MLLQSHRLDTISVSQSINQSNAPFGRIGVEGPQRRPLLRLLLLRVRSRSAAGRRPPTCCWLLLGGGLICVVCSAFVFSQVPIAVIVPPCCPGPYPDLARARSDS
jgi:hypothetical protein